MKVRRCPQLCHGPCPTCGGSRYVHEDGTPATAQEMVDQLKTIPRPKPLRYGKPSRF